MYPAGWYHAQGDPPNTNRYWDGTAWAGPAVVRNEPKATPAAAATDGPTLAANPVGPAGSRIRNQEARARPPAGAPTSDLGKTRFERLVAGGLALLFIGALLGICGHNMVTLFSTPAQVQGTVTDFVKSSDDDASYRIEITSNVGVFYASGNATSFSEDMRNSLEWTEGTTVTVSYSERTGGLIAIDDFDQDRRDVGQYVWPALAAVAFGLALAKILYDFRVFRDGELLLAFVLLAFLAGPAVGWALTGVLDSLTTSVLHAP